jgi:hypothetical protein
VDWQWHVTYCLLRLIYTYHAVPMPLHCRVNSHMPCRASAILRQYRVLRESPRGSRKYPNCMWEWYASGNNLRGTPRGSQKKPNAGRSPTCRLWTADANSHMTCHAHAALCRGLEKSLSEWHGCGMSCVNQTWPHCVNHTEKTQSKPLAELHSRGMTWERHGLYELACRVTVAV